jgi:hypothetical protein
MRTEKNDAEGKSIIVQPGDDLQKIPESHRMLLTPQLREAFAGAGDYFREVADRCPFSAMEAWLRGLTADGVWDLVLHRAGPGHANGDIARS